MIDESPSSTCGRVWTARRSRLLLSLGASIATVMVLCLMGALLTSEWPAERAALRLASPLPHGDSTLRSTGCRNGQPTGLKRYVSRRFTTLVCHT